MDALSFISMVFNCGHVKNAGLCSEWCQV